jgi:hypothetical protein
MANGAIEVTKLEKFAEECAEEIPNLFFTPLL